MSPVLRCSSLRNPSRWNALAGGAGFVLAAFAVAPPGVRAEAPAKPMKPTLAAGTDSGNSAIAMTRTRTAAIAGATGEARLVSFATRDLDIHKLDATAFGDGEDVVR